LIGLLAAPYELHTVATECLDRAAPDPAGSIGREGHALFELPEGATPPEAREGIRHDAPVQGQ